MIAQQVIDGHDRAVAAALNPSILFQLVDLTVNPANAAGGVHIGQIDPLAVCIQGEFPNDKPLIVFHEEPFANIYLQVIIGRDILFIFAHVFASPVAELRCALASLRAQLLKILYRIRCRNTTASLQIVAKKGWEMVCQLL